MGLIEDYLAGIEGICATCDHVVQIGDKNLIACEVRDKFILPDYPPAHGNCKCKDWKRRTDGE